MSHFHFSWAAFDVVTRSFELENGSDVSDSTASNGDVQGSYRAAKPNG
jgi:hypothetical protein